MYQSSRTTFIVLRDNKESGPYTLDQLREMGLKSSDLIWVEGQSVYWLSPHQVPELREFPLDEVKVVEAETLETLAPTADQAKQIIPDPIVKTEKPQTSYHKSSSPKSQWDQYLPKEVAAAAAVKPVAEVKDLYTKPELEKISFPAKKRNFPVVSPKLLVYGGLLIAGVALGLLLRRKSSPSEQTNKTATVIKNTQVPVDTVEKNVNTADSMVNSVAVVPPAPVQPKGTINEASNIKSTVKSIDTVSKAPVDSDRSDVVKAEKNDGLPAKESKPAPRQNLSSLVSVHTNDYTVASFGGIRNLQLTVRNESKSTLEKVAVELNYLKPRDELLKSETVYFYLVPPEGSQTVAIKKSTRGIKVTCRIIKIDPRDE